jgi:hypothetical protein
MHGDLEQRLYLRLQGGDRFPRQPLAVRAQLDHAHPRVLFALAPAHEPTPGGAIDQAAHVGAIAAKNLCQVSRRPGMQGGAEKLRLLGRQAVLAARAQVCIVEGSPQPAQRPWPAAGSPAVAPRGQSAGIMRRTARSSREARRDLRQYWSKPTRRND